MIKALLKKQFAELGATYVRNKKTGKMRSKAGIIGFVLLFVFLFALLGVSFYFLAGSIAEVMISAGLSWLYLALVSSISVVLGVFGSVFTTYAGLYQAKDNELLLSMPIKPSVILFVRLTGVYATGLLYGSLVMIPSLIAYFIYGNPSPSAAAASVLTWISLSFLILTLTCILGWVVALVASKLKNKSFVTVFISIAFIAGYYIIYFNLNNLIENLIAHAAEFGEKVRGSAYPLYVLGKGADGDWLSFLIVFALIAVLTALTYLILSRSFIRIATTKSSGRKTRYTEKKSKVSGIGKALYYKEWARFSSSPTYMLNTALGTLLMPVVGIIALIKGKELTSFYPVFEAMGINIGAFLPPFILAAVCLVATMNAVTAPSVSLEGNNLWIIRSSPADTKKVLDAKQYLHLSVSVPPVIFLTVCIDAALGIDVVNFILTVIGAVMFSALISASGLALNLKMPNLDWTNETVAVKQSVPALIVVFGGWAAAVAIGVAGFFAVKIMSSTVFILICIAVFALAAGLINLWIDKKGTEIFENL